MRSCLLFSVLASLVAARIVGDSQQHLEASKPNGHMCNFYIEEELAKKIKASAVTALKAAGLTGGRDNIADSWAEHDSGYKALSIDFVNQRIANRPNGYHLHVTLCYPDNSQYFTCKNLLGFTQADKFISKYKAWLKDDGDGVGPLVWDGTITASGNDGWIMANLSPASPSIKNNQIADGLHVSLFKIDGSAATSGAFVTALQAQMRKDGLRNTNFFNNDVKCSSVTI